MKNVLLSFFALATGCLAANVTVDPADSLNLGTSAWKQTEWNTDGNAEGWLSSGTSATVSSGVLAGTTNSSTPQLTLAGISGGPDLDLAFNDYLDIRLKVPASFSGDLQVHYGAAATGTTTAKTGFASDRIITIPNATISKDGAFHTYRVDTSLEPWWRGALSDLRLQIGSASGVAFELDYLRVGDTGVVPVVKDLDGNCNQSIESKHFIFGWNDTPGELSASVTAARARSNLRDAEEAHAFFYKVLKYPRPRWTESGGPYKINFICLYGGYWAATSGVVLNIDPSGLTTDPNPPSWVIPHELAHNFQGGLGPNVPGEYHEFHANYSRERWIKFMSHHYPGATNFEPGVMADMHLNLPTGRNYYLTWPFYLYLDTNPDNLEGLGDGTVADAWQNMVSGETMHDSLARTKPAFSVKDLIGYYARRGLTYDYPGYKEAINAKTGGIRDWEQLTEPIRRPDDTAWWRVPPQRAPMQTGFTLTELVPAGTGAGRQVSVELKGLLGQNGEDWRASLIIINDSGVERYTPLFGNNGIGSVTLAANENRVYLVVAATPADYEMYYFDEAAHPFRSDPAKRRFHYEFKVTGATPKERSYTGDTTGFLTHANGGGLKAPSANVAATAWLGPNARVLGSAQVLGNARVEDYAVVRESARLQDNAIARGHAEVFGSAVMSGNTIIADFARLSGSATLSGSARMLEHSSLSGGIVTDQATLKGGAGSWGGTISGNAILDGDYAKGRDIHNAVMFGHRPWAPNPDEWLIPLPPGIFASYEFNAATDLLARDTYAATDGLLRGSPSWTASDTGRNGILSLNGTNQWVQLERSVSELPSLTVTAWVKWNGGAANQALFQFGDGGSKFITFTPSNASGVAELRASDGTNTYSIPATSALPIGVWTQVAVSLDGNFGKISIGGVAAGSGSLPIRPEKILPPNIGANPAHNFIGRRSAGNFLNGSIDDFNVYGLATPTFLLVSAEALESTLPENAPAATFRFTRTALAGSSTTGNLTINYTVSGSATPGSDFIAPSGTVVIPDGQEYADVELPLILDTAEESSETIVLTLTASNDFTNNGSGSATVSITNIGDLSSALLAWYKFDETSGTTANDSSGNAKHASLVNGPVWNTAEKALSFDDANDDDDSVQTPVPNGGSRTLAAWFRPESSTWVQNIWNYNAVFDSDVPGGYGAGWGVVDSKIRVMLDDQMWDTGISVNLNQWQHGILTFDSSRVRFYLNGVLAGSFTYGQGGITTASYTIGSKAFDGQIRDAKIYDRVVYASEAQEIFTADSPNVAPRNLVALPGQGQITLGWQAANDGETSYTVRRATISGGPYTTIASGITGTSFLDATVSNGTTYYYVVAAANNGGTGPDSNQASATPSAGAGLPPPWQHGNVGTAAGAPTTSFSGGQVAVDGAGAVITSGQRTDSFHFVYIPLIGDCTVTAKVDALGSTNAAAKAGVMIRETLVNNSRHASTLISPAATNNRSFIRRASTNGNSATTNATRTDMWVRITRTGTSFSSFTSADGTNWEQLGTTQTVSMPTANVVYAGLAVCSGSTTTLSNAVFSNVSITGGYPSGLSATAGDTQVALSWNAVAGATSYRVKRATTPGGTYTLIASPTATNSTNTGLTNGTTYYYVVSAHNGTSESANSSEVFATPAAPLPSTPLGLLASDLGSSVQLSWSASTNAAGYRVKRALSPDGPFTLIGSPTGTSFTDTAATPGVNFFYTVAAANTSNEESGDSDGVSIVRVLHFDPNGPAVGSVTDGGSYSWLSTNWAVASGGLLNSGTWQSGKQAFFAATSPGAPLAYSVDLANFNTATHGNFTGIRALNGTVTFTGNVSNFQLTTPATITADPGAAIVFNQTRSGNDVQAFNLNGQSATFHGDITVNSAGIGNNGSVIVGSGNLKLGNAIANYSPAATTLQAGATLTNIGAAGKAFNLGTLTLNGATLATLNAGGVSYGNYTFSGSLTVGGTAASLISTDIRCGSNATHTLNIGETGEDVDLLISGKLGHFNGLSWGYANKTGPGTLKLTGINNLGGMTVSEGRVILDGVTAIASMDMTSLTNNAAVILSVPTGTVSYPRALLGNGLYTKIGAGTLELTSTTAHAGNHLVQEGVLRLTQASLGNASTITLNVGTQINLAFTGRDTIGALILDGTPLPPGIYSAATHPAYITGTGSLKVAAPAILAWNNSAATGLWNGSDTNWTNQAWVPKADAIIAHTATAETITVSGNPSAFDVLIGNGTNNANYTLLGGTGATLTADLFTVQGTTSNNPGLGTTTLTNLAANIASDLGVGRWDLVIGGTSAIQIGGQLRSTSTGGGTGDWGRVTLQDTANVTATGGVNGAGASWGLTLNGGTLTTPNIRAAENTFGAGVRLTLNGTTMVATQDTTSFLTVDSTSQAYVGSNGARFDTNGKNISAGVKLIDVSGQNGTLTKLGGGTLTLTAANTITGNADVLGGTLYANPGNAANNRALSYVSGITVRNGATLRTGPNGLFGWDGTQEKPVTVHAGGMLTADSGADIGVGTVTLAGGTLTNLGPSTAYGSWRFDNATDVLRATENSTVSAVNVKFANGGSVDVATGKTLDFSGTITNASSGGVSSLIKTGAGTLLLSGPNNYTGPTTVRGGTLNLTGSITAGGDLVVADAGVGALLSNAGTLNRNAVTLGAATNSVGGLTQSAGSTTATFLHLGLTPGSYGALKVDGGTFTVNGDANVGSWGSSYQTGGGLGGSVEISSGTVNVTGWITMGRWGATQDAVLHVSGGNLTYGGGGLVGNWNADGADTSIITVSGNGSIATTNNTVINLSNNSSSANTGILNLNGGTVTPARMIGGRGFVNFNGGTLRAYSAQTDFLAVASAFVHSGGAVIDSNDKAITIGQALLAPTGSGVVSVAVTDGGSGYTCAPIVKITGGTSSVSATAVASMVDDGTGQGTFKIASLTITSPGVYTAAPTTVALIGGGTATTATFGTPVLAANASGALTKNGAGTLTLTAANTYTGGTTVNAGTLTVSGSAATLGSGNLSLADGATCAIANPNGAVANTATVSLTGTAKLDLAAGVNETVRFLHLNGVLQPAGSYTASNLPASISGSGSLIVTEGAVLLTPAEAWRDQHFNSIANTGDAADDADPDSDGSNNLLERALGTNPLASDSSGKPAIDQASPDFSFTFTRSKTATDLTLVVEVCSDLNPTSWEEAILTPAPNADGALSTIDDTRPDVQVQRFTATTSANRMFYRLRARQ